MRPGEAEPFSQTAALDDSETKLRWKRASIRATSRLRHAIELAAVRARDKLRARGAIDVGRRVEVEDRIEEDAESGDDAA